ncbi:MAG: hypothetical protein WA974_13915 [Thermodesulfobacteriota bacterium]
MKFFVPGIQDKDKAEEAWLAVKKFAEKTLDWEISNRRISRVYYRDKGKDVHLEVGQLSPDNRERVLMILKSNTYLVCAINRGFLCGMPLLIGKDEIWRVEHFED